MKKYIKPNTKLIDIEILPVLYGDPSYDYDTGHELTKGNGEWIDEEEDLGW